MRVIQVTESLAVGDAVGNDVVAIDGLLKQMGICGGIYVTNSSNINKRYLHTIAEPIEKFPKVDGDVLLLYHHCIACDWSCEIPNLICRKVLIYHNITPPTFFEGIDDIPRIVTQRGLDQLQSLREEFDCCIADSEFNKQDLMRMGFYCPIYVCPVLVPFEDYRREPNQELVKRYSDGRKNILFVGRLVPNKKQEDIIRVFAIYKKYYEPKARLFLVGSDSCAAYPDKLRSYIKQIGVEDVFLTGSIPFPDILAYYTVADVFVCMSEHEGFCVPLVEAMFFDIPILAYDSCAVPYTLGGSGVILRNKDYALAAGWIHRLVTDDGLRDRIVRGQRKRLEDFSYEYVAGMMRELLSQMIERFSVQESLTKLHSIFENTAPKEEKSFVLVLPIKASDWYLVQYALPKLKQNLNPRKIVVISSMNLEKKLPDDGTIVFANEDTLVPGMTLGGIQKTLARAGGDSRTAGWFLQQFLKLGFSRVCTDKYYLVWDVDTLPLKPISFFDEKTGKPYLNLKREYIEAYFRTMENLLGLKKYCPESFISEHMLFQADLCRRMLADMESNRKISGKAFWEKCIYASDFSQTKQSFSEYETFGTYVMSKYPNVYSTRKLRTLRCGKSFLGEQPTAEILSWTGKDFDTVSFEHFGSLIEDAVKLSQNRAIRENFSLIDIIKYIYDSMKIRAHIGTQADKDAYDLLCTYLKFDYSFGDETVYEREQRKLRFRGE